MKPNDTYVQVYMCTALWCIYVTELYFFMHMCFSFPVIVPESNKTADATCPRRKTRQTNFEPRGDTKYTVSPEKMAYKAKAIRSSMKQ